MPALGLGAVASGSGVVAGATPYAGQLYAGSAALTGAAVVAGVAGARSAQREQLMERLEAGLAPMIGRERVRLRARRWVGGWVGTPRRVSIRYDPTAPSDAPDWERRVIEVANTRLQALTKVASHDVMRCRLVLEVTPRASVESEIPSLPMKRRVDDIVEALFGKDASCDIEWDGDEVRAMEIEHRIGVKISASSVARGRVERIVSTMMPGRWRARWDLELDRVRLEVRPEIPSSLSRQIDPLGGEWDERLPYAVDEDGQRLYWDLGSSAGTPHFLATGSTGTGKTVLLRGLVLEACRRGWETYICDPKRVEFVGVRGWSNVRMVATAVEDIVAVIHHVWAEMDRRYSLIETGEATKDDFPRLLLVLDEYRYFYGVVNAWYSTVKGVGGSKQCPILEEVFLIASLGRTAKVNIILGTQRPDADWLGGDVRDQFMARASLGRLSPDGARMMWDAHHIGVSVPRGRPGRGTSVDPSGRPVECQTYWTPDPLGATGEELEVLEQLRPVECRWPELVVVPPELVDENGNPVDPKGTYTKYRDADLALASDHPDLATRRAVAPTQPLVSLRKNVGDTQEIDVEQPDEAELDYAEPTRCTARAVVPGQMVLVDEQLDIWGVVDSAEPEIGNDDEVAISWVSDEGDGQPGVLVVGADERITVREAIEPPDDSNGD